MSMRVSGADEAGIPKKRNAFLGEPPYRAGVEDALILPVVALVLLIKAALRSLFFLLMRILDFSFPLLMQLIRFPLFTVRVLGDGIIAAARGMLTWIPMAQDTRRHWYGLIGQKWSALRRKISYHAFEQAVHHAFEGGMDWVFARCRKLTPRTAVYVIVGAVLWLPISLGLATAMHALLIWYAAWLPAWMQLLHPLATIIAKSKLLVLPVYPAAWPQAKRHPTVQGIKSACRSFADLYLMQKAAFRYRQLEEAMQAAGAGLTRLAYQLGVASAYSAGSGLIARGMTQARHAASRAASWTYQHFSGWPLIGPVLRQYASCYNGVPRDAAKTSARLTSFWQTWSVKFSAEYYETKEREKAPRACSSAPQYPRPAE